MKIGFVVNDLDTESPTYTTTRLALTATQMEHEVWLMGVGDFTYLPDGSLSARARAGAAKQYKSPERYLADVQGTGGVEAQLQLNELDVVLLRNDPADDAVDRPWAVTAGVAFGQLIEASGVFVVNDPGHLAHALNKAYFQHFPEIVRPRTLISRDEAVITDFVADLGGRAVLKPLQGSGGSGVFLVSDEESPNLNQIIEAISRDGYVVAQEHLPAAAEGDVRLFVLNGEPLVHEGHIAAFRRVNEGPDLRSNMSVGGKAVEVEVTADMLRLVEVVRPKLLGEGMFLVGLDIVGDKLMEVNVFSPGGLGSCQRLYGANFAVPVIADLERKVELHRHYGQALGNLRLATL
ncbi:MAG TPA: glutathione synthetase [Acidimicrobiales bacterium]|nr:glutathione synthetase [Acidimicrobiales bacterium]